MKQYADYLTLFQTQVLSNVCLQECSRVHAHEDPAVSRDEEVHPGAVQQSVLVDTGDDTSLHGEQTADTRCRTHVPQTPCHRAAALSVASLCVSHCGA